MKHYLYSTPSLILLDLQYTFNIDMSASDYAIGVVLTQYGHLMARHSETLSKVVHRYPMYDKEMYSIVHSCRQWMHYII